MQVKVFITPRKGILDPQGRVVEQSLKTLGFGDVSGVKVGKYIVLEVAAKNAVAAREETTRMCQRLLANPNIEDFSFEVEGE